MCMIRFNLTTKEIEIEGAESFIDEHFDMLKKLAIERSHVKKTSVGRSDEYTPEGFFTKREDENTALIVATESPELHEITKTETAELQHEIKPPRSPVRKYILRKAGSASNQDSIANLAKEAAGKVSLMSLRDKLGLTEQQIAGILREAEKQGRVRKDADGSYVWV
jgi:hypothetical protein